MNSSGLSRRVIRQRPGRSVELDWLDVGGSSETLRYIESEYKNKPTGIGIDVFFGGGYDPYLALKKAQLLEPYTLPKALLDKIPERLTGVPLYDPDYTWYGATLAGFGIVYNKVVLGLTKLPVINDLGRSGVATRFRLGGVFGSAQERQRAHGLRNHSAGLRLGKGLEDHYRPWLLTCAVSPIQPVRFLKTWQSARWPTA